MADLLGGNPSGLLFAGYEVVFEFVFLVRVIAGANRDTTTKDNVFLQTVQLVDLTTRSSSNQYTGGVLE